MESKGSTTKKGEDPRKLLKCCEKLKELGLVDFFVKYQLKVNRHTEYYNLILFHYDQLLSPFEERVVQGKFSVFEADNRMSWNYIG
jgi:hypothetical protein